MSINQTLTAGFIDLATYDELEKYLYGGPDATTYFVALVKTSTWFTLVPTVLTKNMGQADWGQEWAASISRAGDYLVHTWLRGNVSSVTAKGDCVIRWCHNFAHNLIREAAVTFNDLVAARFDNWYLDFWAAFTVPASKQVGYNNMIGNTPNLTGVKGVALNNTLPAFTFNLPLPFFFTRDTGVALPTAALPYNEMRIQINTRNWTEMLVAYPNATSPGRNATSDNVVSAPTITGMNIWAEYAIVSNDERKRMGCAPRDILIEQVQTAPRTTFTLGNQAAASTDIRFSHAVKLLLFAAQNTTVSNDLSNYTVGNLDTTGKSMLDTDPIAGATLLYENTARLAGLPADYYSLVEPWYKAPTIPAQTGYHMYSYSANMYDINPMGSTNYGKLTNVTLDLSSAGVAAPADNSANYKYQSVIIAVNHNVIRISGGALGFPVL